MTIVTALGGVAILLAIIVLLGGAEWLLGELLFLPGRFIYSKLTRSTDQTRSSFSRRTVETAVIMILGIAFWVAVVAVGYAFYQRYRELAA